MRGWIFKQNLWKTKQTSYDELTDELDEDEEKQCL